MIATIGYRFAATAGIALVAGLAVALPARAQSLDDFYAKAKGEGAFAFYVGGPTAPWEARAKVFEERFPGIKVTIGGGFSNVLDKKVDAQLAAGKLEVDAVIFQTAGDFGRWKAEGRLLAFKPDGFDKMDAAFKDADGTFWATMVNVVPYMYNTEKVAAADIPNSALDFLKPQFQGKVVTAYPADDDVTLWVFNHIVQKYGWSYMDKYMAQKPTFIQGHLGEQRSIGSGQNLVTFDSILDITEGLKRQGQPVEFPHPDRRRAADLAAVGHHLQGRAASERGKTVPVVAVVAGATSRSCRPGRRAATCRRRRATSRSCRTRSPTTTATSSPTRKRSKSCARSSKAIAARSSIPAACGKRQRRVNTWRPKVEREIRVRAL